MSVKALRLLNGPYMRVLRRIAGLMRFGANDNLSDHEVRVLLDRPSIDCYVLRKRLAYVGRIVRRMPPKLTSFLRVSVNGVALPWVCQMLKDFATILQVSADTTMLPPSVDSFSLWPAWIRGQPLEWAAVVAKLHFTSSVLDPVSTDGVAVGAHVCADCSGPRKPAFVSA